MRQPAGGSLVYTSNFVPDVWSVRELDNADTLHTAIAAFKVGMAEEGWDLLRGVRVLRWLRTGDMVSVPSMRGIWGEAADRARRLLRKQEAQIRDSQDRLQEILAISGEDEFGPDAISAQVMGSSAA